jgi:hypothetical protein
VSCLIGPSQNKIENDASVDDVRKDEQEMQSILTYAYSSTGQTISQELRDSIEALQLQVLLHFLKGGQLSLMIYSELSGHLGDLDPFLGTEPFRPGMGLIDKMKVVLKQAGELLASEFVAKTLTEVNRKIASSLQNFVVRAHLPGSITDILI